MARFGRSAENICPFCFLVGIYRLRPVIDRRPSPHTDRFRLFASISAAIQRGKRLPNKAWIPTPSSLRSLWWHHSCVRRENLDPLTGEAFGCDTQRPTAPASLTGISGQVAFAEVYHLYHLPSLGVFPLPPPETVRIRQRRTRRSTRPLFFKVGGAFWWRG